MSEQFVQFIDITSANAGKAPLVVGGMRAYYATGSSGIEETATQLDAARDAGMGIALYDQTPSLASFASGWTDIADMETLAGTQANADAAVAKRQILDLESTVYCSFSRLAALRASIFSKTGVWFGVADYSWSLQEAMNLLVSNPDWGFIQFGDPTSNPNTLVPGTHVTLAQAQADINVARIEWANKFLPKAAGPKLYAANVTVPAGYAGALVTVVHA